MSSNRKHPSPPLISRRFPFCLYIMLSFATSSTLFRLWRINKPCNLSIFFFRNHFTHCVPKPSIICSTVQASNVLSLSSQANSYLHPRHYGYIIISALVWFFTNKFKYMQIILNFTILPNVSFSIPGTSLNIRVNIHLYLSNYNRP